jgi:hypothetical protein
MQREAQPNLAQDLRILKCIRRANLDALWSLEPRTVSRTLAECKRGLDIQEQSLPSNGTFPIR